MFDLTHEILQTLRHNKMRTFLTGIAVAWGVFMLIVLLGMSHGMFNATAERFNADTERVITVYGGTTNKAYRGYKEGRSIALKDSDIGAIDATATTSIDHAMAAVDADTAVVRTLTEYISSGLTGVYPEYLTFQRLSITNGRFISDRDIEMRRKVIVLNEENARVLFGGNPADAVGKRVESMGLSWVIVGVYHNEWRRESYAPFSTVASLKGGATEVSNLNVLLKEGVDEAGAVAGEEAVRKTLARTHSFDPDDSSAIYVRNRFTQYLANQGAVGILLGAVWVIGLLTLLSGIVGVSNIMFVSVRERTHEIGIRRAIGAKPRSILVQVVAESVAIMALFGYIGIVMGILVTEILDKTVGQTEFIENPTVSLSLAMQVTVVLIIVGAIAGLFPAVKATKVRPVEALRDE